MSTTHVIRQGAQCVTCERPVIVPLGRGLWPYIEHGADRLSPDEPCPRREWPVADATRTDDD